MMIAAGGLFTVFSTLIMFDLLLTAAVLAGVLGMLLAWRRGAFRWGALVAAVDVSDKRLRLVRENLDRLGLRARLVRADASRWP